MIGFLEKAVWVITILVILINVALVAVPNFRPQPPLPHSAIGKAVEGEMTAAEIEKFTNKDKPGIIKADGNQPGSSTASSAKNGGSSGNGFGKAKTSFRTRGGKKFKTLKREVKQEAIERFTNFSVLYDEISKSDSRFRMENGKPIILVTEVAKNSLVDRIGIRKGDKVLSVNGHTVSNPDEAMALYKKLKSEKEFAVEVERGGQLQYLVYRITD